MQSLRDNLMIDRVNGVKGRKTVYIALIEAAYPFLDELFWRHD
jgi:hypothetical protein